MTTGSLQERLPGDVRMSRGLGAGGQVALKTRLWRPTTQRRAERVSVFCVLRPQCDEQLGHRLIGGEGVGHGGLGDPRKHSRRGCRVSGWG